MSPMTHDRWKQIERLQWEKALEGNPTGNRRRLQESLHRAMVKTHGECPPKPRTKPPLKVRLGLWFLKRKLEDMLMNGKKSGIPKIVLAGIAGLLASYGVVDMAMSELPITGREWVLIGYTALVAAAAKFSNPEKKLSHKPSVK